VTPAPELGQVNGDPLSDPMTWTPPSLPRGLVDSLAYVRMLAKNDGATRIMFYIHGANNTFMQAVRRGLALSRDLNYPGIIIVWSWPTEGRLADYDLDTESARSSMHHVTAFFHALVSELRGAKMDIFAHTLRNQILMNED
jgi:esterase/lipase superfamily enzyme